MRIAFAQADGDLRNGQQIRYRSKTDPKLHIDLIVSILSKSAQDNISFLQDTTSDIGIVLKMRSRQPKSLYIKLRGSFFASFKISLYILDINAGLFSFILYIKSFKNTVSWCRESLQIDRRHVLGICPRQMVALTCLISFANNS